MNISRRSFFSAAAAALSLDPERLLWVPGAKLYSIPKPQPRTHAVISIPVGRFAPIIKVVAVSMDGIRCEFDCDHDSSLNVGDVISLSFPARDFARLEITSVTTALVSSVQLLYGES